jgi:hypothetical protein
VFALLFEPEAKEAQKKADEVAAKEVADKAAAKEAAKEECKVRERSLAFLSAMAPSTHFFSSLNAMRRPMRKTNE